MDISVNLVKQLAWSCVWMCIQVHIQWFLISILDCGEEWVRVMKHCDCRWEGLVFTSIEDIYPVFILKKKLVERYFVEVSSLWCAFVGPEVCLRMLQVRTWIPGWSWRIQQVLGPFQEPWNFPLKSCALPCENSSFHDRWTSTPKLVHHLGENNPSHWSGPLCNVSK